MSARKVQPAEGLVGTARLPGDKSISHRLAILGALAEGATALANYSPGRDCQSTLDCLRALGVRITGEDADGGPKVTLEGRGLGGLRAPGRELDAGNSGSTLRMLAGALAAHPFESVLTGDASLRRRPMRRVIEPLSQMGAELEAREGEFPPLRIRGASRLRPIAYVLPVASAQVKTAVLLAGLHAPGTTSVEEPTRTRDHTEIALEVFGASVTRDRRRVSVRGQRPLRSAEFVIPNDLSAAAFFLVAGLLLPKTNLVLPQVGLNPTRAALLDFLLPQGAQIKVLDVESQQGELRGNLHVRGGVRLKGGVIDGALTAQLIDELPVLAVLGTQSEDGLRLRDAAELRVKESDRLAAIAENLRRLGAQVEEYPDGLDLPGGQRLRGAAVSSFGDHRIAMALAVAGLVAEGETTIEDADCADISFPGFFEVLAALRE
jgi:3-phosphoshikimate 1-carboxyvinyltransferase